MSTDIITKERARREEAFKQIDTYEKKDTVLSLLIVGKLTYGQAAAHIGVREGDIYEYMKHAIMVYEDRDIDYENEADLVKVLKRLVVDLKTRTKEWLQTPINPDTDKHVLASIKELRGLITDVVNLSQDLREEQRAELNDTNTRLKDLMNFLTTDLCPDCRGKAILYLKGIKVIESEYKVQEEVVTPTG